MSSNSPAPREYIYRSIAPLAKGAIICLIVHAIMYLICGLIMMIEVSQYSASPAGKISFWEQQSNDVIAVATAVVEFVVFAVSAIFFLIWEHRAYSNVLSKKIPHLTETPGWVVGWWFMPVVCLWKPYLLLKELWRASDPLSTNEDWQQAYVPLVVSIFWLLWLLEDVVGIAGSMQQLRATSGDEHMLSGLILSGGELIGFLRALLQAHIVSALSENQRRKFEAQPDPGEKI